MEKVRKKKKEKKKDTGRTIKYSEIGTYKNVGGRSRGEG